MVSAGSDGTVKIWNFSNGSSLKNLLGPPDKENPSGRPRVDKEVTQLVCVSYPIEEGSDSEKPSHFVATGWDKRLRIWPDDRTNEDENVKISRDLPTNTKNT